MIHQIKKILGSGFYTGYFPFAPGTVGSLLALIIFFISDFNQPEFLIGIIIISFLIGIPLGNYFESIYGKDPKQFTWDEFVGMWIALFFTPKTIFWVLTTFIIWRFFDIVKPFPSNRAEKLKGGLGIMLDDVISGMYSLIIIYIFKVLLISV